MLMTGTQSKQIPSPNASLAPLVSVVVPTYNRLPLLRETIGSILAQAIPELEIIVVDDASTDGTEEYFRQNLIPEVIYIRNPSRCGIVAINRNIALRQARGTYVAFCDDDDIWISGKLGKQIDIMQTDPEAALCYTNAFLFTSNSGPLTDWLFKTKIHAHHFKALMRGCMIPNSSVLIRRDILEQVGYLNEDRTLVAVEDYEFWLRIAYKFRIYYIDEPLFLYRLHSGNISSRASITALKNIRVLCSVQRKLKLSYLVVSKYIVFQYLRFCVYRMIGR